MRLSVSSSVRNRLHFQQSVPEFAKFSGPSVHPVSKSKSNQTTRTVCPTFNYHACTSTTYLRIWCSLYLSASHRAPLKNAPYPYLKHTLATINYWPLWWALPSSGFLRPSVGSTNPHSFAPKQGLKVCFVGFFQKKVILLLLTPFKNESKSAQRKLFDR